MPAHSVPCARPVSCLEVRGSSDIGRGNAKGEVGVRTLEGAAGLLGRRATTLDSRFRT